MDLREEGRADPTEAPGKAALAADLIPAGKAPGIPAAVGCRVPLGTPGAAEEEDEALHMRLSFGLW